MKRLDHIIRAVSAKLVKYLLPLVLLETHPEQCEVLQSVLPKESI